MLIVVTRDGEGALAVTLVHAHLAAAGGPTAG
jgi:hypothetical protein